MDPAAELNEANEIARKILTHQSVSQDEFRYVMMFNLTAMTQLLWEFSNMQNTSGKNRGAAQTESRPQKVPGGLKNRVVRLAPIAAMIAFLAGMGIGYLLP